MQSFNFIAYFNKRLENGIYMSSSKLYDAIKIGTLMARNVM